MNLSISPENADAVCSLDDAQSAILELARAIADVAGAIDNDHAALRLGAVALALTQSADLVGHVSNMFLPQVQP